MIENKKAKLEYELSKTFEAGLELLGTEVKAIRNGLGSLVGSRVIIRGGEAYLIGANFPPYQAKNSPPNYDPERPRKLLLTKKELHRLSMIESGLTLIPIKCYNKGRYLKLSLAIGRKKKKGDKRQSLKEKADKLEIARSLKK